MNLPNYKNIETPEQVDTKGLTPSELQRAIDQYIATQSQYKEDADMYKEMLYDVAKQKNDLQKKVDWYKNRYESISDRKDIVL